MSARPNGWRSRSGWGGLIERIKHEGSTPDGWHQPEGERLLDTQNVNGGGHWFVLSGDDIWFVMNNGRDGDNRSRNNVTTGGAGPLAGAFLMIGAVASESASANTAALARAIKGTERSVQPEVIMVHSTSTAPTGAA